MAYLDRIPDAGEAETPAFVYDIDTLRGRGSLIRDVADRAGCGLLYSMKACGVGGVLDALGPYVDGFGASSVFEARAARRALGIGGEVHLFSPALPPAEVEEAVDLCDSITFNSIGQLGRYEHLARDGGRWGLRVNPGLSHVADARYDPGRPSSKLGVGIDRLIAAEEAGDERLGRVNGLHVHDNCDSEDLGQLLETVQLLDARLAPLLARMEWVNLGGGYLLGEAEELQPLYEAAGLLRSRYGVRVYLEPGAAFVRAAGNLVASVLDLFDSGGKEIAVLDTTVNHMPEVFEYQFKPEIAHESHLGGHRYVLAGRSCLAGDVFGEYILEEPLELGSRVTFVDVGAYALVKAHTFNGINLPSVYTISAGGGLALESRYGEGEFLSRSGAYAGAAV